MRYLAKPERGFGLLPISSANRDRDLARITRVVPIKLSYSAGKRQRPLKRPVWLILDPYYRRTLIPGVEQYFGCHQWYCQT